MSKAIQNNQLVEVMPDQKNNSKDVAVIGMACRFPEADDYRIFWNHLTRGIDSVREISRWDGQDWFSPDVGANKSISKWCGQLENIDRFDNNFFNISPREANHLDPQQRILLEETWRCVEDSAIPLKRLQATRTAVFVGAMALDGYVKDCPQKDIDIYSVTGIYQFLLANRLSFFMGLKGESKVVEAACASSLVALHDARQSIIADQSDYALVAGVNLHFSPEKYTMWSRNRMLSSDGKCKTFDKDANGFVSGEGVGVLLLQPLEKAVAEKNHIYGVIKGCAVNHGGKGNSLTAPRVEAQKEVILAAYRDAGFSPETVTYVEAHGTGTSLGDPIEIEALTQAFNRYTSGKKYCQVGSVKTNIGHLEAAAGIAGLIKVLLMLCHQKMVPTLNVATKNPMIDFENSPFRIAEEYGDWESKNGMPLRAGLSSFGLGGVNVHVLLEEYQESDISQTSENHRKYPYLLSAKNPESLKKLVSNWRSLTGGEFLAKASLRDICLTLLNGREHFEFRCGGQIESKQDLVEFLATIDDNSIFKKSSRRWRLQITGMPGIHPGDNHLLDNREFQKYLHQLLEMVDNLQPGLKEKFFNQKWSKQFRPVFSFVWSSAVLSFLSELGFKPDLVTGIKEGNWLILSQSGMVAAEEVLSVLSGKKQPGDIGLIRPKVALFDPVSRQIIHPFVFTEDYLRKLLEKLETSDDAIHYYVDKARMLISSQYTFKKFIDEWEKPLNQTDVDLMSVISQNIPSGKLSSGQKLLTTLIIASSLRKLNLKWNLSERKIVDDPRFYELLDLLIDNVLTSENLISLLVDENPNTFDMIRTMNTRSHYVNSQNSYPLLNETNRVLAEITDLRDWLERLPGNLDEMIIPGDWRYITYGPSSLPAEIQMGESRLKAAGFSQSLLRLWLNGVEIDWAQLFPEEQYHKLALPAYEFQRSSFWLPQRSSGQETLAKLHPQEHPDNQFAISGESKPPGPSAPPEETMELMTFKEIWQEQALPDVAPAEIKTMVCFLSNPENQQAWVEAAQSLNPRPEVVFIASSAACQNPSRPEYNVLKADREGYEAALRSIGKEYGEVDAVLYLWALEDQGYIRDYANIVHILRAIADSNLKPRRFLMAAQFETALDRCYLESWIGFERSLGTVLPDTKAAVICREAGGPGQGLDLQDWLRKIWVELQTDPVKSVFYQAGKRQVRQIHPLAIPAGNCGIKANGTYLITGGCGGLGYLFAEHFAKTQPVNLILTGRSAPDAPKQEKIKRLEDLGSRVRYIQADVADETGMKEELDRARASFGRIHGVLHAAGIESGESVLTKEISSFINVLQPKIKGTPVLDELLREEPLDFCCYFSSSAAILGDFGSCDYAIGNRFLMAYADYRNRQRRPGKTLVINWPLWKEGGMGLKDEAVVKMYLKSSGQRFLETEEGLAVFNGILSQASPQCLVLAGQPDRVYRFLGLNKNQTELHPGVTGLSSPGGRVEIKGLSVAECLMWDLKEQIGQLLKIDRDQLYAEANLADLGFDSISLAEFAQSLTGHYGIAVTPSVFFQCPSLERLFQYFLTEHSDTIREFYREDVAARSIPAAVPDPVISPRRPSGNYRLITDSSPVVPEPIAIIGMSGRFPAARDTGAMWEILLEGMDVVTETPADRLWEGASRWKCGWLPGVSEFDPLFFEISPKEAETIDPRQRLLLQESWRALEDSGYGAAKLNKSKIGMFVGVEDGDYRLLVREKDNLTANHNAILAARLSYFLNLGGPNMAINTACSSGLVAAHQACVSLRNRECDTAIAAGVNLILVPRVFEMLNQAGMLSGDGRCFAFDKRADGMVPGEAVVAVVLKRLSRAEADRDRIYAVIKGSGINYDGKTNGITAPGGGSQSELLKAVYEQFQVNPEAIEYIVTHGTGTRLGDPVEINALYDTFKEYTDKQGYCALTSTKTNFGHSFAASGLVSLIGLVQALRHETIPASLHCEEENEYINWQASPFYVNKANRPWPMAAGKKRTGAVSAFGMSGTNAHLVVEDYPSEAALDSAEPAPYFLLVLSAKTEAALQEKTGQMITFLQKQNFQAGELVQVSYTLLEGRQHFNHRMAIVVRDGEDAVYLWQRADGKESLPNLFHGKVSRNFKGRKVMQEYAQELLRSCPSLKKQPQKYQETLYALADLYCQGYELPWSELFGDPQPHCISLPTYPFAKEHYWVPQLDIQSGGSSATVPLKAAPLHPLLQQNTSDLSEQRFSSTFTGAEFFLADHRVEGKRVLPGVACLEMVRAAVERATGTFSDAPTRILIQNTVWSRPIVMGEQPREVHIGLYPEANGDIAYEIYSGAAGNDGEIVHSQGRAVVSASDQEAPSLDLKALQAECNRGMLLAGQCYEAFRSIGLEYGPAHQGIEAVYIGADQVLAQLILPSCVAQTAEPYGLHPSIMDSAFQAAIGLLKETEDWKRDLKPALPFALQELEIWGKCDSQMWVWIRPSQGVRDGDRVSKLDLDLCDETGQTRVRIKALTLRVLEGATDPVDSEGTIGTMLLHPEWKEQAVTAQNRPGFAYTQHWVMLCELNDISRESIETKIQGIAAVHGCLILESPEREIAGRYRAYTGQVFAAIQNILKEKPQGQVLIQVVMQNDGEQQVFSGMAGLLKTAMLENPNVIGQLIGVESGETAAGIGPKLRENTLTPTVQEISYQDGKRMIRRWSEIAAFRETEEIPWKDGGVYLITGGAGGLGLIFTREIIKRVQGATLVLTGRSPLSDSKRDHLKELEESGARVEYRQTDVTQRDEVDRLIQHIRGKYQGLNGIIHSAGIIRDNFILKKTEAELQAVLEPKVTGLVNLDQVGKDLELDYFICFSSTAGGLGNPGQADYAAANAFMDAYAQYRTMLVERGERRGRTLAVNWPLWQEGGMQVDEATEKMMARNIGLVAMRTPSGIQALYQGLATGKGQVMVVEGRIPQLRQKLLEPAAALKPGESASNSIKTTVSAEKNSLNPVIGEGSLWEKTANYFKQLLASSLKLPMGRIEADAPFEKYGIDSMMIMQLTNQLEKTFGSLSKTLFFEYQNIQELTGYFLQSYRERLQAVLGIAEQTAIAIEKAHRQVTAAEPINMTISSRKRQRFVPVKHLSGEAKALDIAVIGLAGRYPGAGNVGEFWRNLRDGKDSITEIPEERWDHRLYFDEDKNKPGKTYSKWGGFLKDVDCFDPLFFNISPREAELMDPQERLFLECVYATLEDAGYTREILSRYQGLGLEGNIGVYVGVMYEEYQLYGAWAQAQGYPIALAGSAASIANRVSYFCNFHGPSVALDTMCSSSLTAIHLACQSIQSGGCELAIAGGVNVSIHPNKYLLLGQGKFVSSKGRCESFGQGGDGYVPGEGVGAVLLKPLAQAIAAGDHIYGVIKGTALNHGGKTNGYTVPNPNAQAGVIGQAFHVAGIDPRTIGYIEAHGTGTSLGDPIEITGLVKAFEKYTANKRFCAIGSAKSNIGHCESAAGIAGITKVLLQLKYRQLVPSLHAEVLNPNIDFADTPFIVQQELTGWERRVVAIEGVTKEYPRRAGISSFGAGGSNAHIVIEEYISKAQQRPAIVIQPQNPAIIVLSARNEARLKERAGQLLTAIKEQCLTDADLTDIAYTLQTGREAMEERLGVIAGSMEALVMKLAAFLEGQAGIADLYRGQAKRNREVLTVFSADEDLQRAFESWINKRKYAKLLELWVNGLAWDWERIYGENKPRRISLPTYPFARERYWAPELKRQSGTAVAETTTSFQTEKAILIKQWRPKETGSGFEPPTGVILVLGTDKTRQLALSLFKDTQGIQVIPVAHGETAFVDGVTTDFYSAAAGETLYRRVKEKLAGKKITGVIDLCAYDDEYEQSAALETGKLIFLQKLIAHDRQHGYSLIQVTYRLNKFEIAETTMQGARLAGLYRMLGTEYRQIKSLTMDTDCPLTLYKKVAQQIQTEFLNRMGARYCECCYRNELRYEPILKTVRTGPEIEADNRIPVTYQPEEVVLISGGSRGIGAAIAEHIVSRGVKNLIVMGREALPDPSVWKNRIDQPENLELAVKLKRLQSYVERGVKVRYYNTPLSDETGIREMVAEIHQELGPITGVFHCAGLVSKTPVFFEKRISEIESVCEPKMKGLAILERALAEEPLSFFVMFASISGLAPALAVGQSDYAMANAYMDYYAMYQTGLGKTYVKSLQWPAWSETGMAAGGMDTSVYRNSGLVSHSTAAGLALLDVMLRSDYPVSLPCVMRPDHFVPNQLLQTQLTPSGRESGFQPEPQGKTTGINRDLRVTVREWLQDLFSAGLKLSKEQWDREKPFDEYGVDSIILAQLAKTMQERISQQLDPSLLLQFRTLDELTEYFVKHHGEAFGKRSEVEREIASGLDGESENEITFNQSQIAGGMGVKPENPDVAIIGIACRFPGSPDKEAYWNLLTQGVTAIGPAPPRRRTPRGNRPDYAGWIDEVDLFDAKFFKLNEADAAVMDPQARVVLEESLKAIYDAGYGHRELSGRKIGVYIGGRLQSASEIAAILQAPNPILGVGQNYLATNISRFFNFTGPGMVVDTACSSGLTGMSLAVEALQGRRIEMALAGAVNLLLNPNTFAVFAARNILSPNGEFHIFEEHSAGEVLGEGAGVVLLKRLDDATRDGNRIYGVIKAVAINNDGRTLGPGSPNIHTQKQVMREALALSGKRLEEIGYIEVNGGGSPVVDAVEIKSLGETYHLDDPTIGHCFLGSVKPNIGHLLSASGMAELIRCVLSVYHQQIPPFLSARQPFPYYDFGNSRIRFNRETIAWEVAAGQTRVAALNSFPDGGTNCHLIIEEFTPDLQIYQPLFVPKELPEMDRKVLNAPALIPKAENTPVGPESGPGDNVRNTRKLENWLSGLITQPPQLNPEKAEAFKTKWGEYHET
jgi:polyketide synthase PksN